MISSTAITTERKKSVSFTELVAIVCVVDILMFPYIRALSCSLSMLLIVCWYGLNLSRINLKGSTLLGIYAILLALCLGYVLRRKFDGLTVGIVVIYGFLLFDFFEKQLTHERFRQIVSKVLFVYITFAFIMALLYIVVPDTYFSVRAVWSMGNTQIDFSSRVINRFTFIYSDPNNAGSSFAALLAYVLICEKHKPLTQMYYFVALLISTVVTFSVQAVVSFGIVLFAVAFIPHSVAAKTKLFFVFLLAVLVVTVVINREALLNSEIGKALFFRLENSDISTGGGRVSRWESAISNTFSWYNLIIGKGAVVSDSGLYYLPHSGHLHLIISYGLATDIVFCKKLFALPKRSKWGYYTVLLPMMIAFTINTGVSDYRFVCTLVLLAASVHTAARKERDTTYMLRKRQFQSF